MPRPFRRAPFGEQAIVGGIKQIFIVERVMTGEDRRDIGVKFCSASSVSALRSASVRSIAGRIALLFAGDVGGGGSAG